MVEWVKVVLMSVQGLPWCRYGYEWRCLSSSGIRTRGGSVAGQ